MNITELPEKNTIFLEDLSDLWIAGSVQKPTEITLKIRTTYDTLAPVRPAFVTLFDELFLANPNNGLITMDLQNFILERTSEILMATFGLSDAEEFYNPSNTAYDSFCRLIFTVGENEYEFRCNLFSEESKSTATCMDYLELPRKGFLRLNMYTGNEAHKLYLQTGSRRILLYEKPAPDAIYGCCEYNIDIAGIIAESKDQPFRFVMSIGEDGKELRTCVYRCVPGDFEEYLFRSKLGGFVYFPMKGTMEFVPEYNFENTVRKDMAVRIASSSDKMFCQYTGGLSAKTMTVLSELVLSPQIYHKVDGEWVRVFIEDADLYASNAEGLNFGSFRFRTGEDDLSQNIDSIRQNKPPVQFDETSAEMLENCPLNTGDSEANLSAENLELNNPETFTEDAATAAMEDVQEQTDNEL